MRLLFAGLLWFFGSSRWSRSWALRRDTTVSFRGGYQEYEEELDEVWVAPTEESNELEDAWRSRIRAHKVSHPSYERFLEELSGGVVGGSRLLSAGTRARLLGTALLAFEREKLAEVLRTLPRVSRGQRLGAVGAPHVVQEALASAIASALGADMLVIDEQRLRKVRRRASGEASKEEAIRALATVARERPTVVWIRDDCLSRSRKAATATKELIVDQESQALFLFATASRPRLSPPSSEQRQAEEEEEEDVEDENSPSSPPSEDKEVSSMFERALKELAARVAQQARRASDDNHPSREYLEALGEALGDEAMLKALAESWAPMLKDPHVKVHVALSVGDPNSNNNGKKTPSKLRDVLASSSSNGGSPNKKKNVPASLLQWMSVGVPNQDDASSASRSEEAESLSEATDDLVVEEPTSAEARRDWERWAREDERKWRSRRNAAALRLAFERAGLEAPDLLDEVVEASYAAHVDLRDDDVKQIILDAFRVQLSGRHEGDPRIVDAASLAAALAENHGVAETSAGGAAAGGAGSTSSSSTKTTAASVAQDKHERALASHVVSPRDVSVSYASIGGLDEAKRVLREAITYPLKYPHLYSEGVAAEAVKGVLLFGPPGTGKTMLAKAVATEGGASFLSIDASAIENKWLGESEKNAKAVFSLARRLAPCVVYLDEIDSLLSSREGGDDTSHGTLTSVKTTLMQEWDGLRTTSDRVVVIGSTNRPYDLDEAVLRRMPRRVLVDLPDLDTRAKILQVTLRDNRLDADVNLTKIARKLDGYSGSDVKEVCREAVVKVANAQAALLELNDGVFVDSSKLRAVTAEDFEAAIAKLKSSVSEHGPEMTRVLEWNDQYGEVKKKNGGPANSRAAANLYL